MDKCKITLGLDLCLNPSGSIGMRLFMSMEAKYKGNIEDSIKHAREHATVLQWSWDYLDKTPINPCQWAERNPLDTREMLLERTGSVPHSSVYWALDHLNWVLNLQHININTSLRFNLFSQGQLYWSLPKCNVLLDGLTSAFKSVGREAYKPVQGLLVRQRGFLSTTDGVIPARAIRLLIRMKLKVDVIFLWEG